MSRPISHHELPTGTVLLFTSTKGNTFKVKLLDGVFEDHSRRVEVIEAPVSYDPSAEPTIMCVVPPRTRVKIMFDAYKAAISTVGPQDAVYLIDRHMPGPVAPFRVKTVQIV